MDDKPFFSVIIPTYNRASFITKTIESVVNQTFRSFEIIVVDDGSTDNTEKLVRLISDTRFRYYKKSNEERAVARNFGTKLATGHYVTFLDSDDLLFPDHLQSAKGNLDKLQNPEIFHQGYEVLDVVRGNKRRIVLNRERINDLLFTRGNIMSCMGVFLRHDVATEFQFNVEKELTGMEDWELWIRLAGRFSIYHDDKITGTILDHDYRSVTTGDTRKIEMKVNKFIDCIYADPGNVTSLGKELDKAAASALTYAALHILLASSNKRIALNYLLKGIRKHPSEIFKKRFLVIVFRLLGLSLTR